jgi:hypothetical protein
MHEENEALSLHRSFSACIVSIFVFFVSSCSFHRNFAFFAPFAFSR